MQELFYEESARIRDEKSASIKYNIFKTLSIISYVLMCVWIVLAINAYILTGVWYIDLIFIAIPLVMFLFTGILLGKVKNKFYIDYDYTFVTGSIRIAKVIKNLKRKFVIKFDTSDIEKLGKYGSELYEKYSLMPGINKLILTSNATPSEDKDFYYIVVNNDGDKKLLIMECTQIFIINVIKFANKTVLDDEFRKELLTPKKK